MANHDPADRGCQRFDPLLERIALIRESKLRPMRSRRLRDTPRNRSVVGNTQDQAALACHQPNGFRHNILIVPVTGRPPPMTQRSGSYKQVRWKRTFPLPCLLGAPPCPPASGGGMETTTSSPCGDRKAAAAATCA